MLFFFRLTLSVVCFGRVFFIEPAVAASPQVAPVMTDTCQRYVVVWQKELKENSRVRSQKKTAYYFAFNAISKVTNLWLSTQDMNCIKYYVLEPFENRPFSYGEAWTSGGLISAIRGRHEHTKSVIRERHSIWKQGFKLIENDLFTCNQLVKQGFYCEVYKSKLPSSLAHRQEHKTYVLTELMVPQKRSIKGLITLSNGGESAFLAMDLVSNICSNHQLVTKRYSHGLIEYQKRWNDFCGPAKEYVKRQNLWKLNNNIACNGNSECHALFKLTREIPDVLSVLNCFTNKADSCLEAHEFLIHISNDWVERLKRILPMTGNPFGLKLLNITAEMINGCIVGGNRFISDIDGSCDALTNHLQKLSKSALVRGCNLNDLDACLALVQKDALPIVKKISSLERKCVERGECGSYIKALPLTTPCSELHSVNGKFEWAYETGWQPILSVINNRVHELCEYHDDFEIMRKSCILADQADRRVGLFNEGICGQRRAQEQDLLRSWQKNWDTCLRSNGQEIIDYHRACAQLDFGKGTIIDNACQQQSQRIVCR